MSILHQTPTEFSSRALTAEQKRGVPEGLWIKCPGCDRTIYRKEAERRQNVCPNCQYHFYVSAQQRVAQVLDDGTFEEWDAQLRSTDPLEFKDKKRYSERLVDEQQRTGLSDAALTGTGMIRARRGWRWVSRIRVHHGQYGIGRRRAIGATGRTSHRPGPAADHHQCVRWRSPHA